MKCHLGTGKGACTSGRGKHHVGNTYTHTYVGNTHTHTYFLDQTTHYLLAKLGTCDAALVGCWRILVSLLSNFVVFERESDCFVGNQSVSTAGLSCTEFCLCVALRAWQALMTHAQDESMKPDHQTWLHQDTAVCAPNSSHVLSSVPNMWGLWLFIILTV